VAVEGYRAALDEIKKEGGEILCGGHVLNRPGYFVEPTIVRAQTNGPSCSVRLSRLFYTS
jgi:aldehyde dehydrogenase (NAD+)